MACLIGCAGEVPPEEAARAVSFRMATRAAESAAAQSITDQQLVRVYVAERKPENGQALYCDTYYDLEGESYHIENLPGVWHKFAFVCVPNVTQGMASGIFPTSETFQAHKDLYQFTVSYTPVLDYQSDLDAASQGDLAIYRKVIDRWIDADMPTGEDVVMGRITGELLLDMGKPADQFDTATKGAVTSIAVRLKTSESCYIRDEACDSVIVKDRSTAARSFVWRVSEDGQLQAQRLPIALLPGTLEDAVVTISFESGDPEEYALRGRTDKNVPMDAIAIKKNTRTIVRFNGTDKEMFEVRYAGFADGDDAAVDVEDDAWNGIGNEKGGII